MSYSVVSAATNDIERLIYEYQHSHSEDVLTIDNVLSICSMLLERIKELEAKATLA